MVLGHRLIAASGPSHCPAGAASTLDRQHGLQHEGRTLGVPSLSVRTIHEQREGRPRTVWTAWTLRSGLLNRGSQVRTLPGTPASDHGSDSDQPGARSTASRYKAARSVRIDAGQVGGLCASLGRIVGMALGPVAPLHELGLERLVLIAQRGMSFDQ